MIEQRAFLRIVDSTPLVSVDLLMRHGAGDVILGRRVNRPCRGYRLPEDTPLVLDEQHAEAKWWRIEELLQHPGVHENTKAYFR
jgi:colanic acid biosynthesis protein WcaH